MSVLGERAGYIASPGYTDLHSGTPGQGSAAAAAVAPGSGQRGTGTAPRLCTLTVLPPASGPNTFLELYVRDLDFRSMHEPTTPTDGEEGTISTEPYYESCIKFTEPAGINARQGFPRTVCSLTEVPGGGLVFTTRGLRVDITYWSINEDFNDFLLYYTGKSFIGV